MIKFEKCQGYQDIATIPTRATEGSAGYDFYNTNNHIMILPHKTATIYTGIKAYMDSDTVLNIYIRSSVGIKLGVTLCNSVGVVDSDFVNNSTNEGNIILPLYNNTNETVIIKPYERIAQGIFTKFIKTDDDNVTTKRTGGVGSTNDLMPEVEIPVVANTIPITANSVIGG